MANVRSEYLQKLIESKNNLEEQFSEIAQSTIENILGENIQEQIRKLMTEDEDEFTEDEVEDVITSDSDDAEEIETDVDVETDTENGEEVETDTEVDLENVDSESADEGAEDEEIWNDLEQFKGDDGEYDLTGMDGDNLIKVMQVLKPEDGVRVVKTGEQITLTDDSTDKEYIISLDCEGEECDVDGESDTDGEDEFEIELTTESANLGYGVRQKETAMTTPSNPSDTTNKKQTHGLGTEPTGTDKRFGKGIGDGEPFDDDVNEEYVVEVVSDEDSSVAECGNNPKKIDEISRPYLNGDRMKRVPDTSVKGKTGRNTHKDGKQEKSTSDTTMPVSGGVEESIKRKANEIFKENHIIKTQIIPGLTNQVNELKLITKSLGNVVKLVMENSITLSEKKAILNRFNNVKSFEESDKLYGTISEELKREGKTLSMNNIMNSQLSESKKTDNDVPMYQNEELSGVLEFMTRLNKVK